MEINQEYSLIQQYLADELSEQDMHGFEKQALEDPFLADALEGYSYSAVNASELSILQKRLETRILEQQELKNTLSFTWQRLSIGAAAGLLFILAGILFWLNSQNAAKNQTQKQSTVVVEESAPKPIISWDEYKSYLKNNVKVSENTLSGSVLVSFTVNPSGELNNFRIINGLSNTYNAEAIRVIKEGPKWTPAKSDNIAVVRVLVPFGN